MKKKRSTAHEMEKQLMKHKSEIRCVAERMRPMQKRVHKYCCYSIADWPIVLRLADDNETSRLKSTTSSTRRVYSLKTLTLTYLIILLSQLSAAHSNINSVWLSKDDPSESQPAIKYHIASSSNNNDKPTSAITSNNDNVNARQDYTTDHEGPAVINLLSDRSDAVDWSTSGRSAGSVYRQLQASPSSLQPAIASLDQESERRSDTDSASPLGSGLASGGFQSYGSRLPQVTGFNNEASSLDSMWSVNQTNSQVQFDEEHAQQASGGEAQSEATSHQKVSRRQDNETSTLAPKHEIPVSLNSIKSDSKDGSDPDRDRQLNNDDSLGSISKTTNSSQHMGTGSYYGDDISSSKPATDVHILSAASFNQSQTQQQAVNYSPGSSSGGNNLTSAQQNPSFIYYIPDGYKWQPTNVHNSDGAAGVRRKLHTSGTQYDLRELSNRQVASTRSTIPPPVVDASADNLFVGADGLDVDNQPSKTQSIDEQTHQVDPVRDIYISSNSAERLRPPMSLAAYGLIPTRAQQHQTASRILRTTQMPASLKYPKATFATDRLYKRLPIFAASNQQPAMVASSVNKLLSPHSLPHQYYHNTILRPRLVTRPPRYHGLQYQQVGQQQHQPTGQWPVVGSTRRDTTGWRVSRPVSPGAQRLRQPIERQKTSLRSKTTKPPKKSLLGALGSRLTSWVEPIASSTFGSAVTGSGSNSNQNRGQNLEDSFYEIGEGDKRTVGSPLTGAQWSAANFYLIDPVAPHPSAMLANLAHSPVHGRHPPQIAIPYYPAPLYAAGHHHPARQPTVAPAPDSLHKFYAGDATGHHYTAPLQPSPVPQDAYVRSTRRRRYPTLQVQADSSLIGSKKPAAFDGGVGQVQQQPASFIPVVAVSVTKTSPAPRPTGANNAESADNNGGGNGGAGDVNSGGGSSNNVQGNNELYDYLDMKTGSGRQKQDDYGNLASGSVNRDTTGLLQNFPAAKLQPTLRPASDQQTTTVKSAIFGYMPHEANKPLMDALNAVPHYATRAQLANDALAGGSHGLAEMNRNNPLMHDSLSQHPQAGHLTALDEPPSLALQLQANSFAQNDIAHPFASSPVSSHFQQSHLKSYQPTYSPAGRAASHHQPIPLRTVPISAVYPTSQAQYHGFQLFQPQDAQHPQILSAAATDLNPLLMPIMFASPHQQASYGSAKSHYSMLASSTNNRDPQQQQQQDGDQSASSSVAATSTADLDDDTQGSGPLNKGKKRSSDFFASAGQLLLSALPLLLAPTLGLMFASNPLPVARYHAPTDSFSGGANSMQSGIPGNYLSSLNQGQVFNSSPVQLFTPSPPAYNQTSPPVGVMQALGSSTTTSRPASSTMTSSGASGITNTTSRPVNNGGQRAVQLMAANSQQLSTGTGGLLKAGGGGGVSNRTTATAPGYGPQRITLTLTTPSYGNESDLLGNDQESADGKRIQHHVAANTLLLLTNDDDGHLAITRPDVNHQHNSVETNATSGVSPSHYMKHGHIGGGSGNEIGGYEGVDFDAQFPSLRKSSLASDVKLTPQIQPQQQRPQQTLQVQKPSSVNYTSNYSGTLYNAQRQQLQQQQQPQAQPHPQSQQNGDLGTSYEHDLAESLGPHKRHSQRHQANNSHSQTYDSSSTKLYPVSTWPPMRRRTVSLITSDGNKTLPDASEKYQNIDYYSDGPARLKPQSPQPVAELLPKLNTNTDSSSVMNNSHTDTSYAETNFDDPEDTDETLLETPKYNPLAQQQRKPDTFAGPNRQKHQSEIHSGDRPLDFLFSNGLATVSLTSEPLSNRRAGRSKRDTSSDFTTPAAGDPIHTMHPDEADNTSSSELHSMEDGKFVKKLRKIVQLNHASTTTPSSNTLAVAEMYDQGQLIGAGQNATEPSTVISKETQPPTNTTNSTSIERNSTDILRIDASNGRSAHVVAAMVARVADEAEDIATRRRRLVDDGINGRVAQRTRASDDYQPSSVVDGPSNNELRELLLRRNATLDRISSFERDNERQSNDRWPFGKNQTATIYDERDQPSVVLDTYDYGINGDRLQDVPVERPDLQSYPADNFSYGGRGRIPPPVEVTSTRFRLTANGTAVKSKQRSGNGDGEDEQAANRSQINNLELTDDTKKALANIGSVLLKEGLAMENEEREKKSRRQQEGLDQDAGGRRRQTKRSRQRDSENWRRRRPEQQALIRASLEDTSATERSLMRATPSPRQSDDEALAGAALRNDDTIGLSAREALIDRLRRPPESVNDYQMANSRAQRVRETERDGGSWESPRKQPSIFIRDDDLAEMRREHNRSHSMVRDRVNLFENGGGHNFGSTDDQPDHMDDYQNGRPLNSFQSDNQRQSNRFAASSVDRNNFYRSDPKPSSNNSNNVGFYPNPVDVPYRSNYSDRRAELSPGYGNEQQPSYYNGGYSQVHRQPSSDYSQPQPQQQNNYNPNYPQQPAANYLQYPPASSYSNSPFTGVPESNHGSSYPNSNNTTYAPQQPYVPSFLTQKPSVSPYYNPQRPQQQNDYPMVPISGYNNRPDNSYAPMYSHQQQPHLPLTPPPPQPRHNSAYMGQEHMRYPSPSEGHPREYNPPPPTKYPVRPHYHSDQAQSTQYYPQPHALSAPQLQSQPQQQPAMSSLLHQGGPLAMMSPQDRSDSRTVNEYLKRVQFSDSDRDKLMASYLTCDGLLNDNDHCLERLSCEFSDPQNIEKANKLDRAVSSM